jgi:hypothetical protein
MAGIRWSISGCDNAEQFCRQLQKAKVLSMLFWDERELYSGFVLGRHAVVMTFAELVPGEGWCFHGHATARYFRE